MSPSSYLEDPDLVFPQKVSDTFNNATTPEDVVIVNSDSLGREESPQTPPWPGIAQPRLGDDGRRRGG
jgi:hypothetical protein